MHSIYTFLTSFPPSISSSSSSFSSFSSSSSPLPPPPPPPPPLENLDYIPELRQLTFEPDTGRQAVSIEILSDDVEEEEEVFFVLLFNITSGVELSPVFTTITIIDASGEFSPVVIAVVMAVVMAVVVMVVVFVFL